MSSEKDVQDTGLVLHVAEDIVLLVLMWVSLKLTFDTFMWSCSCTGEDDLQRLLYLAQDYTLISFIEEHAAC